MTRKSIKSYMSVFALTLFLLLSQFSQTEVKAEVFPFVILNNYSKTLNIGDEFYLIALTTNGKTPTFKSSASSIAAVNTYGLVTAKKSGSCKITAKIKGAEASCIVTVNPTRITLNKTRYQMENGAGFFLTAKVSNGHDVTYKSSKTSVCTVNDKGYVEARKPGTADITVKADNTTATCKVTVKSPKITLSKTTLNLYRTQEYKLGVTVSSGRKPVFKTNRKSVATVDSDGRIIAVKHGTAIISVSLDGVTKNCTVNVKQPVIKLSKENITLACGKTTKLKAATTGKATPVWSSSNSKVASVDMQGNVTANKKGKCYIYAAEDGVIVKCTVIVK